MAKITFQRGDRRSIAENCRRCLTFRDIATIGRRAVGTDIADITDCQPGSPQRLLHANLHGFLLRLSDMCRITVGGKADNLAVNGRTTRLCMFQRLQDQRTCPFANH
ncbi:hypothetical protein D3C71_1839100 [compost metagenome]